MLISFRPLLPADLPTLAEWQSRPHVARWWRDPSDLASITAAYEPCLDGREPTEVFILEVDGESAGLMQRYLVDDYPAWAAALGIEDAAGMDYYIGEERMTGRGIGSQALRRFAEATLDRYPGVALVVADPQQDNEASWRALENAGFERLWAGDLETDDPSDEGPAFIYGLTRAEVRGAPGWRPRRPGAPPR